MEAQQLGSQRRNRGWSAVAGRGNRAVARLQAGALSRVYSSSAFGGVAVVTIGAAEARKARDLLQRRVAATASGAGSRTASGSEGDGDWRAAGGVRWFGWRRVEAARRATARTALGSAAAALLPSVSSDLGFGVDGDER